MRNTNSVCHFSFKLFNFLISYIVVFSIQDVFTGKSSLIFQNESYYIDYQENRSYLQNLKPSTEPSYFPMAFPTYFPSNFPTFPPTLEPNANPTFYPTVLPTTTTTQTPSTQAPSVHPTTATTQTPTALPTPITTNNPTVLPTTATTQTPTVENFHPSYLPISPPIHPSNFVNVNDDISTMPSSNPTSRVTINSVVNLNINLLLFEVLAGLVTLFFMVMLIQRICDCHHKSKYARLGTSDSTFKSPSRRFIIYIYIYI